MLTKYIIRALLALTLAFVPYTAAQAVLSSTIAGVYGIPSDFTAGATTDYTIKFRTIGILPAGTVISGYASEPTQSPTDSTFDFSSAEYSSNTLPSDTSFSPFAGINSVFTLTLGSDLVEGTYEFTLSNVVNASATNDYYFTFTTDELSETAGQKFSAYFGLGTDAINSDSYVSNVQVTSDSSEPGTTSDVVVSFETLQDLTADDYIYFYFDTASYSETTNSAYDVSTASFNSDTISGALAVDSRLTASVDLDTALTAGSHSFTLSNVTHPSTSIYFTAFRLSANPIVTSENNSGAYINSSDFDVVPDEASDNTLADQLLQQESELIVLDVPTKLKVKNIKRRSATLKWKTVDGATYYKVQLRKKSGKKVKTFKNLTENKQAATKKYLKPGKTYKFRVKACDESSCSAFSDYKKFTTEI